MPKILTKMFGLIKIGDTFPARRNLQLHDIYGEPDIGSFVRPKRLKWLGHVERIDSEWLPRKLMYDKPRGRRRGGRPRFRRLDDVEEYLRALSPSAANRSEWNRLLVEAWVHLGLHCHQFNCACLVILLKVPVVSRPILQEQPFTTLHGNEFWTEMDFPRVS